MATEREPLARLAADCKAEASRVGKGVADGRPDAAPHCLGRRRHSAGGQRASAPTEADTASKYWAERG